jgi:hypothetical protein
MYNKFLIVYVVSEATRNSLRGRKVILGEHAPRPPSFSMLPKARISPLYKKKSCINPWGCMQLCISCTPPPPPPPEVNPAKISKVLCYCSFDHFWCYRAAAQEKLSADDLLAELKSSLEWGEGAMAVVRHVWKEEGPALINMPQETLSVGQVCVGVCVCVCVYYRQQSKILLVIMGWA